MSDEGKGDALVENPVALWPGLNQETEEECLAISEIGSSEMNHIQAPYLDEESNRVQLFHRSDDASQCIGAVNIESSNNVHIGHVFKTIIQGEVNGDSPDCPQGAKSCKKTDTKPIIVLLVMVVLSGTVALGCLQLVTPRKMPEIYAEDVPNVTSTERSRRRIYTFTLPQWGGRGYSDSESLASPVNLVIIKHTNTKTCTNVQSCFSSMQTLQDIDVGENHEPNIAYNFVIGGSGDVYEGRGWGVRNAQMDGSIDVAFMGNFDVDEPTDDMLEAGKYLIKQGIILKQLDGHELRVVAHNQTQSTNSPGRNLFEHLVSWPYYSHVVLN